MNYADVAKMRSSRGFTLIEMMISMAIGMVILVGLSLTFQAIGGSSRVVASRTERMADLYLASQIMQGELRQSRAICWDKKSMLIYQPLDSAVALDTAACSQPVAKENGSFQIVAKTDASHPTPYIFWKRPNKTQSDELIRDMSATGLTASQSPSGVWSVSLTSQYVGRDKQTKSLDLTFKAWKRN